MCEETGDTGWHGPRRAGTQLLGPESTVSPVPLSRIRGPICLTGGPHKDTTLAAGVMGAVESHLALWSGVCVRALSEELTLTAAPLARRISLPRLWESRLG